MTAALAPRNISRFCGLLQSALEREEESYCEIGPDEGSRPDHFVLSMESALNAAFAPEFAIAYLVRKEVRCQGDAIEWNPCKDRNFTDLCLVINDGYAASFEIKGPWGISGSNNPLKNEAQKVNQFIPDVPAAERYDGWSLSLQDDQATKALEQFVRSALQNLSAVIMYVVSNPNPISLQIKRAPRAMSRYDGHGYECLRVIVFNGVKPNEKCDGCRQQVAASKLLPIGGGSIKVCRTCLVQATAMVRQ